MEQVLDLKTTSFEEIIGRIKIFKERVSMEEEEAQDNQKLMYTNSDAHSTSSNQDSNGSYRGRGHGGRYYNRGRGRGRYNGYNGRHNDRYYGDIDLSKITCFCCDKSGHYASTCPDRLLKLQEATETKEKETDTTEAEELMVH